ncbi:Hypothetical protein PHPALM_16385 [Phytophthora palmivora]|uniref:Uncharacterized protein n=1 Tax=Phytophthora palmivora TaxID=4796 RepID=A0A2P4XPU6_9STRA|nr:Hypothetical protein PHPALM_16385 [Phytophthora palmivora]
MTSASANTGTLVGFIDDKTHKIFSWIDMVLSCNLSFSFCETEAASNYVKIGSLSTDSLVKYMSLLVREVETVIGSILPKSFGIIFDGWTFRSEHYVAVFASFRHDGKAQNILIAMAPIIDDNVDDLTARSQVKFLDTILSYYGRSKANIAYIVGDNCAVKAQNILIAMAPIIDDNVDDLTARSQVKFLDTILSYYGRSKANIAYIVGDNCAVNGAVADKLQVPMVGCASHRLNLAVNLLLAVDDDLLNKVQKLMCKIRNSLLVSAKLRRKTRLHPVLNQDTRWSSIFDMVKTYFELKEFLCDDDDGELAACMPTRREEKQLNAILVNLKMFESTSKKLQSADDVTLLEVRDLFDALISQKPEVAHYLRADADIVKSPGYERACVNVLLGRESTLSPNEEAMLDPLAAETSPPPRPSEATWL